MGLDLLAPCQRIVDSGNMLESRKLGNSPGFPHRFHASHFAFTRPAGIDFSMVAGGQEPVGRSRVHPRMLKALKADFLKMKQDRTGERFKNEHRRARKRGFDRGWRIALFLAGAFVSAAVGVVLVFIPGPAFVFFILAGALVAIP